MTATQDDTIAELQRANTELRRERDAGLVREATLAEELAARDVTLAQRNTEYSERIEHQAATIDVLKAMSASPGDPQPVFDLIVQRARDLCDAYGVTVTEFDGTLVYHRASTGISDDPGDREAVVATFPMRPTRNILSGRAILDRQIIRIDDLQAEPDLHPMYRHFMAKSTVLIPLLRGDVAIGTLGLGSRESAGFTDSQIELLKTFAEQAVIAISTAETYRNLHEALEQQTATAEVLEVINISPGDLTPVFDAMLEKAMRLCGAAFGSLYTYDGERFHSAAQRGVPPAFAAYRAANPFLTPPGSGTATVLATRRSFHFLDLKEHENYRDGLPGVRAMVELGGVRTVLVVPLVKDDIFLGYISVFRQEVRAFSGKQIVLLENFAAQAVIAMENARLIAEQREALEQQTATAEVLQVINASPGNLEPVFDTILDKAMRLCGVAFGILDVWDGEHVRSVVTRGLPTALADWYASNRVRQPGPMAAQLLRTKRPQQHPDTMEGEGYRTGYPGPRALVELGGARTGLVVPLLNDDTVRGWFTFFRQEVRAFSVKEIALLESFAAQAVIAMENARLLDELRQRTADLQQSLEYQTATSDVLKVISRSTFDLQPVLAMVAATAARLCVADQAAIYLVQDDMVRLGTNFGFPPEYEAWMNEILPLPVGVGTAAQTVSHRAIIERSVIHIPDVATVPGYPDAPIRLGRQRTSLGVPLLREGEPVGLILLARQRVEPFASRQIELVSTFAAQAVIAIENTRLITEQREALEQQTATAEVLQVINANPGNLTPVFDAMLDKAMRLCDAAFGELYGFDGEGFPSLALKNVPAAYSASRRAGPVKPIPGSFAARFIAGEYVIHIPDLKDENAYRSGNAVRRAMVDLGGARTAIAVALHVDDQIRGALIVYRQEVRPFSGKQIAVLENFAAQAVIAMENARLITEQREALEQQTATAEVLQVINGSPGDLTPVFDAMLERATRLSNAAFGLMSTYDGEHFHTVAMHDVPARYAMVHMHEPSPLNPENPRRRIERGEDVVHILDVADSDAYRSGDPRARNLVDLGGARSYVIVALRKEGTLVGTIAVYRQEVRPFSDKRIALLQTFAAQAVIAMENARLITEQREALEQQTATAEVLQVINASPGNLTPVFDAILEKAHSLCGAAVGALMIYDGQKFHAAATHGFPEQHAALVRQPFAPSSQSSRLLIQGERFVHFADMKLVEESQDDEVHRSGIENAGVRTGLAVPLRKDGNLLGYISAFRLEVRPYLDREIALLENFAAQAVIAMENARLLTETREALEQQTATAEVLQVINASPGNLAPVFDVMLEKALRLCQAEIGVLWTYDGELMHPTAIRSPSLKYAEFLQKGGPRRPAEPQRPLLRGEPFIQVDDLSATQAYRDGDPLARAFVDVGGFRSLLNVALRKENRVLGLFAIYRTEVLPFSDKQIALLQGFAAQAVIAMENARLLDEIRQRQAELRTTFDNMGDGVAMFDADLRLAAWNRNFQQIIDLPDNLLAERPSYTDYLRLLAERGEFGTTDIEAELRHRIEDTDKELRLERMRPDGRVIEVRRNAVPGGGFVLIYSDITERKRSEEEIRAARDAAETALRELKTAQANLIQAEKMASLGQLTAGIAHEIKNPLNFINNFSALSTELIDEVRDVLAPEPLGETARTEVDDLTALLKGNLEKVVQHGQRADGIVRSMLDHSRGSSGERRMVDLNAVIDEALNLAYHGARAQDQSFNITLERDFGEGIAPIEVNPQDITRVFLNLFSNGFYAVTRRARDGGDAGFEPTLKVATRDASDAVEIRVRDNGTGIPADIRDKLFQPFFTTKPTGEGTGLGLSITYDIITQQHGGSIALDSKEGDYSEFTIRLPRNP